MGAWWCPDIDDDPEPHGLSVSVVAGQNESLNEHHRKHFIYVVVGVGTTVGESWALYIVGHVAGIVLLLLIAWYAWKWPKQAGWENLGKTSQQNGSVCGLSFAVSFYCLPSWSYRST